jgi:hypothetical protein
MSEFQLPLLLNAAEIRVVKAALLVEITAKLYLRCGRSSRRRKRNSARSTITTSKT